LFPKLLRQRIPCGAGVVALVRDRAVRRYQQSYVQKEVRDVAGDVLLSILFSGDDDAADFIVEARFSCLQELVVQLVEALDRPLHQRRLDSPPDWRGKDDNVGTKNPF